MLIKLNDSFSIAGKPFNGEIELPESGLTLILGNNGVGKTTLFNHLLNFQEKYSIDHVASFISQYRLSPVNSIKVKDIFLTLEKGFSHRVVSKALDFELFDILDARSLLEKEANHLSGGENQIIKIILGFYLKSKYYFLDEPFQFLDAKKFELLMKFIKNKKDAALVIIDHRNPELLEIANYTYKIRDLGDKIEIKRQ